jgi:methyl-accepting chemotaxis protein
MRLSRSTLRGVNLHIGLGLRIGAVGAIGLLGLALVAAKATEEISGKIAEIQTATSRSVTAIQGIAQTIGETNEIAAAIASSVEEQGEATQEIARNVQQISVATTGVSGNISGISQAAQQTGAAATQVLTSAGELLNSGEALKAQVEALPPRGARCIANGAAKTAFN